MVADQHITEQLLVVRYLFRQGVRALESREPFSDGLSVSLFQDAAELLLNCVAVSVDARPPNNFLSYWDAIEKGLKNQDKKLVPSKAAMARLNTARVAFKHHGQRPIPEDASRFRTDTEVFLKQTTAVFFEIDLDEISMSDLISADDLRSHIKQAERYFAENKFKEALESCGLAAYNLFRETGNLVPKSRVDLVSRLRSIVPSEYDDDAIEIGRDLSEQLEAHRTAILRLMTKTSTAQYDRFRGLIPHVSKTVGGKVSIHWNCSGPPDRDAAREEARFCIDFAIEQALRLAEIPG